MGTIANGRHGDLFTAPNLERHEAMYWTPALLMTLENARRVTRRVGPALECRPAISERAS